MTLTLKESRDAPFLRYIRRDPSRWAISLYDETVDF